MKKYSYIIIFALLVGISALHLIRNTQAEGKSTPSIQPGFQGSSQCRSCHEKFYQLWATSHHGLAMQPYTPEFAEKNLTDQKQDIVIGNTRYRAVIDKNAGYVLEQTPTSSKKYPIVHALGGRNVFYFLAPLDRGILQVLPVAYDVNTKLWFDTAMSALRHFPDRTDSPLHWTDRPYTFNTSCFGCHISQMVKNYDIETDTYNTQWKEPGINCETCHGPADEHIRACTEAAEKGIAPKDLKLITVTQSRGYTQHQTNTACSTCHAKMSPLTAEFTPGEEFFQNYDLVTLENIDYYPDGRDLGENYTYTSWRMSPCVKNSKLDCVQCHTSSGRYRFAENTNNACLPCHEKLVKDPQPHTHHDAKSEASQCVKCHMPKTSQGRMTRSDHSMRSPMPTATIQFESPNACNICHDDKDAQWSDEYVRKWYRRDYQKQTLQIASLIDQARKNNFKNLDAMLAYIQSKDRDEIFANSLIRILRNHSDAKIWPVLIKLLKTEPSPLIRSSIAESLGENLDEQTANALIDAAADPYRLVRIKTAAALSPVPRSYVPEEKRKAYDNAIAEYITAMTARPDDHYSQYNLANFYMDQSNPRTALDYFNNAIKLQKDFLAAYVNSSMAYNTLGQNDQAARSLQTALTIDPNNVGANLNLALLYGEMNKLKDAEKHYRKTLKLDPRSATAAYNLGVILAPSSPEQSIDFCRQAYEIAPENPKYAYTLAYYLSQSRKTAEVINILQPLVDNGTADLNIYMLLARTYEQLRDTGKAVKTYQSAIENPNLDPQNRARIENRIKELILK